MPKIKAGRHTLEWGHKTLIMGILNITPDSFSDGGEFFLTDAAIAQADAMVLSGVDIIDIGGESSRPGSSQVAVEEECRRVVPIIQVLTAKYPDLPLSVDTWKSEVAESVLSAGASIINDIYGLQVDDNLAAVVSKYSAGLVLMHNAAAYRLDHPSAAVFTNSRRMPPDEARYYNSLELSGAVDAYLHAGIKTAILAGIKPEQLIIDPGVGFGVTTAESLDMIRGLAGLRHFSLPVLLAPSRKRFIGDLTGAAAQEREFGTAAAVCSGIACGADIVRVHNVLDIMQSVKVCDAVFRKPESIRMKMPIVSRLPDPAEQHDRITMKAMEFYGKTGVLSEEKLLGQKFIIDVVIELANNQAAVTDNLSDTVSYADVYELIRKVMAEAGFDLIERLAGYLAEKIKADTALAAAVEVTVHKPQAPIDGHFDSMSVTVRR